MDPHATSEVEGTGPPSLYRPPATRSSLPSPLSQRTSSSSRERRFAFHQVTRPLSASPTDSTAKSSPMKMIKGGPSTLRCPLAQLPPPPSSQTWLNLPRLPPRLSATFSGVVLANASPDIAFHRSWSSSPAGGNGRRRPIKANSARVSSRVLHPVSRPEALGSRWGGGIPRASNSSPQQKRPSRPLDAPRPEDDPHRGAWIPVPSFKVHAAGAHAGLGWPIHSLSMENPLVFFCAPGAVLFCSCVEPIRPQNQIASR